MAKGQKRPGREPRKPKSTTAKTAPVTSRSFLEPVRTALSPQGKGRKAAPGAAG